MISSDWHLGHSFVFFMTPPVSNCGHQELGRRGTIPIGVNVYTAAPSWLVHRGRDEDCSPPPAQIRTGPIKAYGSYLGF